MTIVVVGGGLAGAMAASGAREAGYAGRVVVVGDEPHPPYERPPLSKQVLRGEAPPKSVYVGLDDSIEVVTGTAVVGLDIGARRVELGDGGTLAYDGVVLATGAEPRRLTVPGADLAGVHYLRTLDDAVRLGAALKAAERVAVVGAGWIGTEVAAAARALGAEVVMADPSPLPLVRVLGERMGRLFADLHAEHGVTLRLGVGVESFRGGAAVDGVVLADGRVEPADVVVVGVGAVPRTALAAAAGLTVDDGVVVDECLRAAPGVHAAGDVANAFHPGLGRRLRVEHWANALNQGTRAGRNAAGEDEPYDQLPYFYSDQYDLGMEYVGHGAPDDEVVVRGERRELIAFWLRDGRVTAAMNVNVWDVVDDLKALVGRTVDPSRLADPGVPLSEV